MTRIMCEGTHGLWCAQSKLQMVCYVHETLPGQHQMYNVIMYRSMDTPATTAQVSAIDGRRIEREH